MPAADLVTAGEAFEDLIFADLPRLPATGEEVRTGRFLRTIGGGAVITAMAAARMGLRCRVISGLSRDASRRLRRERLQVTNLRRPDEPHAVTAALSTTTNRSFVTFSGMNGEVEARLFDIVPRVRAKHVHFAFFPIRCARWQKIVAGLRARGITTSWDFGWNEPLLDDAAFFQLAGSVDYLMLNEQEAQLYSRSRSLPRAIGYWRDTSRTLILKLGPRGSQWISRGLTIQEPASRVRAVDTTGAGDAFNGGFLAARLAGQAPRRALQAGNRLGALSTRALGGIEGLPAAAAQPSKRGLPPLTR